MLQNACSASPRSKEWNKFFLGFRKMWIPKKVFEELEFSDFETKVGSDAVRELGMGNVV